MSRNITIFRNRSRDLPGGATVVSATTFTMWCGFEDSCLIARNLVPTAWSSSSSEKTELSQEVLSNEDVCFKAFFCFISCLSMTVVNEELPESEVASVLPSGKDFFLVVAAPVSTFPSLSCFLLPVRFSLAVSNFFFSGKGDDKCCLESIACCKLDKCDTIAAGRSADVPTALLGTDIMYLGLVYGDWVSSTSVR